MSAAPQSEMVDAIDAKPVMSDHSHALEKHDSDVTHQEEDMAAIRARNKKANGGLGPIALIFACGTALFSDGYVNANSGPTNTIFKQIYKNDPNVTSSQLSHFSSLYSSMTFAGTLLGMLVFGVLSDRIGRKFGMIFASLWLALFSVLIAGAWGAGGSTGGLFAALEAYRFLLGIAIGAEYPAGSVACSENTESAGVNPKRQQMYFVLATNTMIDIGFVAATLVAFILYNIFGDKHLVWVWRLTLGLGAIPPLAVLFFRVKMRETEHYRKGAIKHHLPWWLIIKKYWAKLGAVCVAWFIYDYISYPASIYSSYFLSIIVPDGDLFKSLGWSVSTAISYV
jgi:MFS family permease